MKIAETLTQGAERSTKIKAEASPQGPDLTATIEERGEEEAEAEVATAETERAAVTAEASAGAKATDAKDTDLLARGAEIQDDYILRRINFDE